MLPEGFFPRVLFILETYSSSFISGIGNTMLIALVSTFIGCIIGLAIGIVQTIPTDKKEHAVKHYLLQLVKFVLHAYVEIFRGTPMMIQAAFIYYGLPYVFGINLEMIPAALLIVSINTGAYMAETVRGGILSIDPGQTEGAMAIGMNHVQTMVNVILPQALRNIMPQIGNNLIINIKDTCVLTIIGVPELTYATRSASGAYYTFFEAYSIAMVFYFILTFICSRILRAIERKMDGPENFTLAEAHTAHVHHAVRMRTMRMGAGNYRVRKNERETNRDIREHKRQAALQNGMQRGEK